MKVCLIVDNPKRDIEGLALVGWHLMEKNIDVIFVPMYEWHEVFFIKPDLVLVNYTRIANHKLISKCKDLKIAIGVLDTEGGILQDENDYFKKALRYAENVSFYCCWGVKQYNVVYNLDIIDKEKVVLTGCPRYDFDTEPWKFALPAAKIVENKKMVLVNTNFSYSNPKFNSAEKEKNELIERDGVSEKYASDLLDQERKTNKNLIRVVEKLSKDFPEILFVIRPHPFERIDQYNDEFKKYINVKIKQEGSVFPWIAQSALLLHQNCSTAVEAILYGVEPINLKWLSEPLLRQLVSEKISTNAESYEHLIKVVERHLNNGSISSSVELKKYRMEIIYDWFYKNDGNSALRVANIIEKVCKEREMMNIKANENVIAMYLSTIKHRDYKKLISQLLFQIFGTNGLNNIKRIFKALLNKRFITDKYISLNMVKDIVNRLSKVVKIEYNYTISYYSGNNFRSILFKKVNNEI